jgi:transcriptional regulator
MEIPYSATERGPFYARPIACGGGEIARGTIRGMYIPPPFRVTDPALAQALIREQPLASLVTTDDAGLPFVSHLPLRLDRTEEGGTLHLLGHLARANPQWQHLQARPRAVVTFLGPQAYMSPKVYPDLQRVPTWNYVALHATVQTTLVHAGDDKDRLLKCLIADHEPAYADQWRALAESYTTAMLAGIVGLEMATTEWQLKVKVNQHRPEARVALRDACLAGNEQERALAAWIDRVQPPGS